MTTETETATTTGPSAETGMTSMDETPGRARAPEWMKPCSADGCAYPPERVGLCAQHRRTLRLTARISDAVREFLNSAEILAEGGNGLIENRLIEDQVIEAGECLAQGLGLLASTQFDDPLFWNPSAIHIEDRNWREKLPERWRVEFVWRIAETDDIGELDETGTDNIGEIENDEIGVMAL